MRLRLTSLLLLMLLAPVRRPNRTVELAPDDPDDAVERAFLRMRAYPAVDVPANARRDAFASVQRAMQTNATASSYTWKSIGPQPVKNSDHISISTGRIAAVAVSPVDPDIVIAGASSGGIWRSADGGASFQPVSDDQIDLSVGSIAFAPSNPDIVYAGMGEDRVGTGVLKSTDAGATWHLVTTSAFPARAITRKIVVDPRDENTVWLVPVRIVDSSGATVPKSQLMKSTDGGVTWSVSFNGVVHEILIASDDGATILIGTARAAKAGTGGIYRSTDRGVTWTKVYAGGDPSTPPSYRLAMSNGVFYATAIEEIDGSLKYQLLSSGDGITWSAISTFPPESRLLYLVASPHDGNTLFIGAVDGLRSTDRGKTWSTLTTHLDQHSIAFDPFDSKRLWVGNDGGLSRSTDGGKTFQSFAALLPVTQFYSVAAHPTDPSILLGGAQDNGLQRRTANTNEWSQITGSDFLSIVFDRNDPSRVISNYLGAILLRFTDKGPERVATNETFGESDDNSRVSTIAPLTEGPDGTVWFGTWRVFASRDFGTSWTPPAGDTDLTFGDDDPSTFPDVLTAIGAAESDANVLYTGSAQGRLMVTHDAAVNWTDASLPVRRAVASIAIDRTSPAIAYAALSGYHAAHVWKTTTFGVTWTDASNGLPDIPVDTVYIDRQRPQTIYAGTDIGVFRSDNGGDFWYPFNAGMPPVIVTSFTTTADGRLIAATYGRGAYELTETAPQPAGPRRRAVRR